MDGMINTTTLATLRPARWVKLLLFASTLFAFGFSSVLFPSSAEAQIGWPTSWNPWKKSDDGTTPADPFSARGTNPEYRVAQRQAAAPVGGNPQYMAPVMTATPQYRAPYGNPSVATAAISDSGPTYTGTPQQTYSPTYTAGASGYSNTSQYQSASRFTGGGAPGQVPAQVVSYPAAANAPMPQENQRRMPTQQGRVNPGRPSNADVSDDLFQPAQIVAIVNGEPILAGDVLGPINQMINERLEKLPEEQREAVSEKEIEEFKKQALKQMLPGLIEIKLVYLDFMRSVPGDRRGEMEEMLDKNYDEYQLQTDLKNAGVNTPAELDMLLRETGGSLQKKKRQFVERLVTSQQIQQQVKSDSEVTHQEMLDYYDEHAEEYAKPARSKWEQLMVSFDKFPNRNAAWQAIAEMGNQVLRGAPLDAVAERSSQGIRASRGGQYDWTTKNSLKNEVIDDAIFSLPVGELSPIIESPEGYHIVRVVQREPEGKVPFLEAQKEIKGLIKKERRQAEVEAYLQEVKARSQVWTIFDDA